MDDNDEFIPFSEEYVVSKYGPISRMVKAKMKEALPVQVTAGMVIRVVDLHVDVFTYNIQ